jgi:hypothetical protein
MPPTITHPQNVSIDRFQIVVARPAGAPPVGEWCPSGSWSRKTLILPRGRTAPRRGPLGQSLSVRLVSLAPSVDGCGLYRPSEARWADDGPTGYSHFTALGCCVVAFAWARQTRLVVHKRRAIANSSREATAGHIAAGSGTKASFVESAAA